MIDGENNYLKLLYNILKYGEHRKDRTGVGTISLFGEQLKFDLSESFPAITTKKLAFKPVVSELLWFLEGSGDERRLAEILYGKPRDEVDDKNTIWTQNAVADYWLPKAKFHGDLGRVYGVQWRSWHAASYESTGLSGLGGDYYDWNVTKFDQIAELVRTLRDDPFGRRHILTAWNPGELKQMALPPCHLLSQFYVGNDNTLSCHMYQRSADMFLGVPFNIASYALLTYMLAQVCNMTPKTLTISFGDAHIYQNHTTQVEKQLDRDWRSPPKLELNKSIRNIFEFKMDDIKLVDYNPHPAIKAPMAV